MTDDDDVAVPGTAGEGYPAALRRGRCGRRVRLADPKGNLGGNRLFEGCAPIKAVYGASTQTDQTRHFSVFGLSRR